MSKPTRILIPLGEYHLRRTITDFVAHYHGERNRLRHPPRVGGVLNYYDRVGNERGVDRVVGHYAPARGPMVVVPSSSMSLAHRRARSRWSTSTIERRATSQHASASRVTTRTQATTSVKPS